MAKNSLFLIHGVGRHGDDWADGTDGPIAELEAASLRYKFFRDEKDKGRGLRQLVDFVPIRYDDLFVRILGQWQDQAVALKGLGGTPEALELALDLLQKGTEDQQTLVAYAGDVPLYRGFRLFAQRVQLRVVLRIAEHIAAKNAVAAKSGGAAPRFSVLAHSLGTTVAHDSLQLLGSTGWLNDGFKEGPGAAEDADAYFTAQKALAQAKKAANPFAPGFTSFESVYMLSNTSPLLHTTRAPEQSIVCPLPVGGAPAAYCGRFYNVDHRWDPISKVRPFRMPKPWVDSDGGQNIVLDHFHDPNVHAFTHYLRHPKVHYNLFMDLVHGFEATDAELENDDAFEPVGGKVAAAAVTARELVRARLEKLVDEATAPAVKELRRWAAAARELDELVKAGL